MDFSLGQEQLSHVFQTSIAELIIVAPTIVKQTTAEPLIVEQMRALQMVVHLLHFYVIHIQYVLEEFSAIKNRLYIINKKGFHVCESLLLFMFFCVQ